MIVLDTHIWVWWVHGDSRLNSSHAQLTKEFETTPKSIRRSDGQQGAAAKPAVWLTPLCGSPSSVMQTAVALGKYLVVQPCFLWHGR